MVNSASQINQIISDNFQLHYSGASKPVEGGMFFNSVGSDSFSPVSMSLQAEKPDNSFYYEAFDFFNGGTSWDDDLNNWVKSSAQPQFTVTLQNLYGILTSFMSSDQATEQAKAAQSQAAAVNQFWSTWIQTFGYNQPLAKEGINDQYQWVTIQVDPITGDQSDEHVSNSNKWNAIQNSVQWMCFMATKPDNIDYALTSSGYKTLKDKNKNDNYDSSVVIPLAASLGEIVESDQYMFEDLFTNNLTPYSENPWALHFNEYRMMLKLQGLSQKGSAIYNQQDNELRNAETLLWGFNSGTSQAQSVVETFGTTSYSKVFTAGQEVPSVYPSYLPAMNAPSLSQADIESIVKDQQGSWVFSATMSSSDNGFDYTLSTDAEKKTWNFSEIDSLGVFWENDLSDQEAAASVKTNVNVYDPAFVGNSMTVEYDISLQTWNPVKDELGSWLLLDALSGPEGVFTKLVDSVDNSGSLIIPYVYDPDFAGGYGFTDLKLAKGYLLAGLAYQKHALFSVNPWMQISGTTVYDSKWQKDSFSEDKSWSKANGWGALNWSWGVNGLSDNNSENSVETSRATISSASDELSIAYAGANLLNPGGDIQDPIKGYQGLPVGFGFQQIAAPLDATVVQSATKRKARIKHIKSKLVIACDRPNCAADVILNHKHNSFLGGGRNDMCKALDGDDRIYGFEGNDFLSGNRGDDFIAGGSGRNRLRGGRGDDYFEFNASDLGSEITINKILDFGRGDDRLYFTGGLNSDLIQSKGNKLFYKKILIGQLVGLGDLETSMAIDSAIFI